MVRREGVVPAITKLRTVNARYTGYTRAEIFGTLHSELYWSRDTTWGRTWHHVHLAPLRNWFIVRHVTADSNPHSGRVLIEQRLLQPLQFTTDTITAWTTSWLAGGTSRTITRWPIWSYDIPRPPQWFKVGILSTIQCMNIHPQLPTMTLPGPSSIRTTCKLQYKL